MILFRVIQRAELQRNFDSVVRQCGIDSPHSRLALQRLLELHPEVSTVRLYKRGKPGHVVTSPGSAAVVLAMSGRRPNRRLKVNGVRVHSS
jgi:hypothetical protein